MIKIIKLVSTYIISLMNALWNPLAGKYIMIRNRPFRVLEVSKTKCRIVDITYGEKEYPADITDCNIGYWVDRTSIERDY